MQQPERPLLNMSNGTNSVQNYAVGDRVEVYWPKPPKKYYPGVILRVNSAERVVVLYDESNEVEDHPSLSRIRYYDYPWPEELLMKLKHYIAMQGRPTHHYEELAKKFRGNEDMVARALLRARAHAHARTLARTHAPTHTKPPRPPAPSSPLRTDLGRHRLPRPAHTPCAHVP